MPVVSTVTLTISGRSAPAASSARWRRSPPPWPAAGPARSRPGPRRRRRRPARATCSAYASRSMANVTWPERRQLGARARPSRAPSAAAPACDQPSAASRAMPGAGLAQLVDPVGDAVLAEVGEVGAERVGLDAVDAGLEVRVVDGAHDVRPGDVEDLVAALVALEVVQRQVVRLQHRAHRAVGDDDALGERLREGQPAGCGLMDRPDPRRWVGRPAYGTELPSGPRLGCARTAGVGAAVEPSHVRLAAGCWRPGRGRRTTG